MHIGISGKERNRISKFLFGFLIFLMLSFPVYLQPLKIVILLLLCVSAFFHKGSKLVYSKPVRFFCISWLLFYICNVFVGLIYNAPGVWSVARLNILYFAIFFFLIGSLNETNYFNSALKGIFYANYFIALYNIAYLVFAYLGLIRYFPIIDAFSGVGIHSTYTHITTTNLSMTIFTFPLMISLSKDKNIISQFGKTNYIIMLALTAIIMLFSGRRILWIALLVSVFYWIIKQDNLSRKLKSIIGIALISVIVITIFGSKFGIDLNGLIDRFNNAFSRVDSEYQIENVRYIQSNQLIEGFKEKPILGHGAGSVLTNYSRSKSTPWAFELSYHKVLYDGGIFGGIIYFLALISIVLNLRKDYQSIVAKGLLLSYIIVLFANATNPYFSQSFDFILFIIIPLLYLNIDKNYSLDSYANEIEVQ